MSNVDNSGVKGNILMLSTLVVTLVVPLLWVLLSYDGIALISGTAVYVAAFAVIASVLYVVGGGLWMFVQDKKDGEQLSDG